mgnify:CR=1 FL=1
MDNDRPAVPPDKEEQVPCQMPITKGKPTVFIPRDLAVVLSAKAFTQLFGWAYTTHLEISCLGTVSRKGRTFEVEEFFLLDQVSTGVHTELDPEALARLVESLRAAGSAARAQALRCWAHSHPGNMGTFWSTTDDDTARLLAGDCLVSIVVSGGFSIRARIDLGGPLPVAIDNVAVLWRPSESLPGWGEFREEVGKRVKEVRPFFAAHPRHPVGKDSDADRDEYCVYCDGWHEKGKCPFRDMYSLEGREQSPEKLPDPAVWDPWF